MNVPEAAYVDTYFAILLGSKSANLQRRQNKSPKTVMVTLVVGRDPS